MKIQFLKLQEKLEQKQLLNTKLTIIDYRMGGSFYYWSIDDYDGWTITLSK